MKKYKNKIVFAFILISVFLLGYLVSSLIHKPNYQSKYINETTILISEYSELSNAIDSIENLSVSFYDTANIEMLHYVLKYNDKDISKFPNYYITNSHDTIEYNKENFFYYVAMYVVAENLLETRKHIINGLIMNIHLEEEKNIIVKTQK